MFCNEYVMTGACIANVAIACRFQPIGHFLTIQILTEIGAAQNQSQNSFEVANPLAAGVEATSPAWHSGPMFTRLIMHVSAAHARHESETCWPLAIRHALPPSVAAEAGESQAHRKHILTNVHGCLNTECVMCTCSLE